jgi:hypothetical protein
MSLSDYVKNYFKIMIYFKIHGEEYFEKNEYYVKT